MTVAIRIRKTVAVLLFLFCTILFCLPGYDIPKEDFFSKIPLFDKWVHIGLFATLVLCWCWALQLSGRRQLIILVAIAALYGLLIEIIQFYFIPGRSGEIADLIADIIGSCTGVFIWKALYKKIDPCRNRGRNQN